jgi:glycosyltransferase involved in cell wall biosynthesis
MTTPTVRRPATDPGATSRAALFVAGDLPWPPDGGGRIATLRVLEAFAANFTVDLVAIADPVGAVNLGPLPEICRTVEVVRHPFTFGRHPIRQLALAAAATIGSEPYRLRKFRSRQLQAAVARLKAERAYDVVHYDQFGVAPLVSTDVPTTMTHQNVESEIYRLGARQARDPVRRAWLGLERDKLARAERSVLAAFDEVFVLAPEDTDLLRELGLERLAVIPMPAPTIAPPREPPNVPTILSLGSMSWFGVAQGLEWFASEVFPRVRAKVPDAIWNVVGAHPSRSIKMLEGTPGIAIHGHVQDLDALVHATRCAIVPLNVAGGIRMKLLDFMAWRVPSVATPLACRGLAFDDGCGSWREEDPAPFANRVVQLLTDDGMWRETVECGVRYVERHHQAANLEAAVLAGVGRAIDHHTSTRGRPQ